MTTRPVLLVYSIDLWRSVPRRGSPQFGAWPGSCLLRVMQHTASKEHERAWPHHRWREDDTAL